MVCSFNFFFVWKIKILIYDTKIFDWQQICRERERERESKSKRWLWIIAGIVIISGVGLAVYFATKSQTNEKSPNPSNIQYLPSHEEAQQKINEIKTSKGIDDQQATIEFLAQYVPYIKWWEINSLSELDEKINEVNSKCAFPLLKNVPNSPENINEFNAEWQDNIAYRGLSFLATVIPRESNGEIDWKGENFMTYLLNVLKPMMENIQFKPSFATQSNYQELERRIKQEINPSLVSICSGFASLTDAKGLNELCNNYLDKINQGSIYSELHNNLAEELNITTHTKYEAKSSGNNSLNSSWNCYLYGYTFNQ